MPYHPATGDIQKQLPRIAIIVALLVAAVVLISINGRHAALPSERWYRLSRQQLMEADLLWQLGEALELITEASGWGDRDVALELRERAIAIWERRTLVEHPNPAAAWRLGVVYGHRGYLEQATDMLLLAATLDEGSSQWYHALAEVYSQVEADPAKLRERVQVVAQREGWMVDLALADAYKQLEDDAALAEVQARRQARALRFVVGFAAIVVTGSLLLATGVATILLLVLRWGLTLPRPSARLPFIVPWTLVDVAEAIAILLFAMVLGGLIAPSVVGGGMERASSLMRAVLLAAQYVVVVGITIGVIIWRVRRRSSHPARPLGLRGRGWARLVGIGIAGYAVFLTGLTIVAVAIGSLFGGVISLAQTTEEIIGSARTPAEIGLYLVLVCVLAPIAEETIFRGYLYGGLRRFFPPRSAIVIGSALFAAVHLNTDAFLVVGLIGALLCYLYERTRSLVPGIVAHALHNGLVLAVMLLQSM